jgi:hypothetical protein
VKKRNKKYKAIKKLFKKLWKTAKASKGTVFSSAITFSLMPTAS